MVNYIDRVAFLIKEKVPPSDLPDENTRALFRTYAVLLLAKGRSVDRDDVHNAWAAWMLDHDPSHESLVPSTDLSLAARMQDDPYVEAIRAVAAQIGL